MIAPLPPDLEAAFRAMVERGASDLFAKAGSRLALRVDGEVGFLGDEPLSDDLTRTWAEALAGVATTDEREKDVAVEVPELGRFRCNVFMQQGRWGVVVRHISEHVPGFEALGLPAAQLTRLAELRRGMVLVTGVAGSGKSTTLAALVGHVNAHCARHVVTIEDPVEYVFTEQRSLISQRELGLDTASFAQALRHVVRQSPDIILVGEMRDLETIRTAISAAETGHLVLSTLHTVNAIQTVERVITYFPVHQHDLVRLQLSLVLEGVISQRLLPRAGSQGRVPAVELLLATPTIREILHEGRTRDIARALEAGQRSYGTQTFQQSLKALVDAGVVSATTALEAADNPDELKLALRGIGSG